MEVEREHCKKCPGMFASSGQREMGRGSAWVPSSPGQVATMSRNLYYQISVERKQVKESGLRVDGKNRSQFRGIANV